MTSMYNYLHVQEPDLQKVTWQDDNPDLSHLEVPSSKTKETHLDDASPTAMFNNMGRR